MIITWKKITAFFKNSPLCLESTIETIARQQDKREIRYVFPPAKIVIEGEVYNYIPQWLLDPLVQAKVIQDDSTEFMTESPKVVIKRWALRKSQRFWRNEKKRRVR